MADTLDQHQVISLPSHPLSEIFLTFWIVDLVFLLLTVYTCNYWARPSNFLCSDYRPLKTVDVYSEYTETYQGRFNILVKSMWLAI